MTYNWCQTYIYIIYGFSYNIGICFLSLSKVFYIRIRTTCYKLTIHMYIYVQKSPIVNSQFSCKYIYRKTTNYSLHLIKVGGKERIKNYRLQKWWNKHTWHKSNTCETCLFYYNIMLNKNNEKIKLISMIMYLLNWYWISLRLKEFEEMFWNDLHVSLWNAMVQNYFPLLGD